ncbi:F-box/LRR-repeat protein 2-like isoform X2 [Odontomachus brunneus]|uniref:F-box/LRR-repeat protein 2-like isoform X2 n=1 Tax=Odontomachus brunneus TaxID=486640 RepID=UPI0013F28B4E|nr:F-box/LRR-repeat protein 2-like isoform X2 [Odontomachus brunneus]
MEETQVYDFQNAPINILNDDCLKHIFQFLPIVDKIRIERVCKRWRVLSKDSWYTMKKIDTSYLLQGMFSNTCFPTHHGIIEFILNKMEEMLSRYGRLITELYIAHPATMSLPNCNIIQKQELTDKFNKELFKIVMKYCSNLTNINVSVITIDEEDKQLFKGRCKKITRLTLGTFYNLDEQKTFFQEYPQLNYLKIFFNNTFVGKCLSYLPAQTMSTLIVRCCWNIDDITFAMGLAKLENLEHLEISCSRIGKKTMEIISNCKKLKILRIYKHQMFLQEAAALHFTNLINLQTLKLAYFPFFRKHFTEIAMNCQQITSLDISGGHFCDDAALKTITALPKLEYLNISFVLGITDNGLKNLKNLKGLECSGCRNITDNGICKILVFSPQLQLLDLSFCRTQIVLTDKHKMHPAIQLITECFSEFYIPSHDYIPSETLSVNMKHYQYMSSRYCKKQCGSYIIWREETRIREPISITLVTNYTLDDCRC